jgi:hypothetical protein
MRNNIYKPGKIFYIEVVGEECTKVFESKMEAVTEVWRRLHNENLHDSYCSSIIIEVIKSRMK